MAGLAALVAVAIYAQSVMSLDDLKVGFASVTGLGNWVLEIDIVLKAGISLATLVYIVLKIREQIKKV